MITLNNSNIDFDLTYTNSILLSDTSNLVFRTKSLDRMIVMDSGNVGIGVGSPSVPLEVAGNIKASGRIVSTGEGFEGKGTLITEIPIDGVTTLRTTLAGLSGTTSDVILNVSDTSNRLVNRTLEEIRYGSNYTFRTSNELTLRIDSTSNALINRVIMETLRSSNYTFASSNLLVNRILEEVGYGSNYLVRMDGNMSNYVMSASNLLVRRVLDEVRFGSNYLVRMDGNMSNYIMTASNLLVDRILTEVGFGSNYLRRLDTNSSNLVFSTSNILVQRIAEQIGSLTTVVSSLDSTSSGLITTTSNILVNRVLLEVRFGSNYLVRLDGNMSNYVMTASNLLVNRVMDEVRFGSNYLVRMDANMSNYVMTTSNLLVNRVMDEVRFGSNYLVRMDGNMSNYVMTASNLLVNRVMSEVGFGSNYLVRMDGNMSNYVMTTSNFLVNRVMGEVGFGSNYLVRMDGNMSNYVMTSSNLLVRRVMDEVGFGSNYLVRMDGNMSNYVMSASNLLVNRVVLEVGFGSNYARDRVGVWGSNYTDRVGAWGSNYTERLHAIAIVRSQWETTANPADIAKPTIFYNAGNVGIGTERPLHNLHIYSSNNSVVNRNASSKIIIQESNTSNAFSSNISDILSVPSVSPAVIEGTIDRYMVFTYTSDNTGTGQTQYDITLPENYSYDVLMVGGGGGGGGDFGGGGGGGAVLYGSNIIIPAGGYTLKVGNGGNGTGQNGYNTEGFNAVCAGGGGAKNIAIDTMGSPGIADGNAGGSGGGGKSSRTGMIGSGGAKSTSTKGAILATAIVFGNVGGNGILNTGTFQSGGGGGAGAVGNNGTTSDTTTGGAGGAGIQLNISGGSLFWGAGGGGGANAMRAGNGGNGGGGAGTGGSSGTVGGNAITVASGMNAAAGSGSGGGGGSGSFQSNGGNGGSGIIVIRYRPLITLNGTPEMQFVIGNTIEAGASNYKIGNYNGNFQIKTSTSNIDRTSFIIQSSANVGVGTSVAVSKLHLFDNSSNAILTLQDNTSIPTLIQPTNISPTAVSPATSITTLFEFGTYDKIISFAYSSDSLGLTGQTQYNFTCGEDITVDILVVGGGGAGGCFGGGGGGGQVLLTVNYNIPAGTVVSMNVGRGGTGASAVATNGQNGFASSITILGNTFVANGGGGGGSRNTGTVVGNTGGSGGGSSSGNNGPASLGGISNKTTYPNSWRSFGNSGGIGSYKPSVGSAENHYGGGGGGAGYIGGTGIYQTNVSGAGGVGVDTSSIFGTSVGASGLFGGGGGGMAFGVGTGGGGGLGGGGGGGTGASSTGVGGTGSTGGGGGGGSITGGSGGTGVVIIRYRQKNREGNSEIQFIKGASIVSGNMNYKMGNYGGDFKVKSSIFNSDSDRFVMLSNGDTRFNNSSGMAIATIFNNGDLRTSGSQISDSDNRIKKDVEDIDVSDALRMILAVEPKTYRYIDDGRERRGDGREQQERGDARTYGFIAQQVKDVIPDATETMKDILPNVMKRAIRDKNRVYLDLTGYGDLQLDEDRKINIRFKNGGGYSFTIVEVNDEYFVIDTDDKGIEEVFVYGYEVKDFHILTKDTIYTLNVSATQELYRKIESQDKKIKELEEKLERVLKG